MLQSDIFHLCLQIYAHRFGNKWQPHILSTSLRNPLLRLFSIHANFTEKAKIFPGSRSLWWWYIMTSVHLIWAVETCCKLRSKSTRLVIFEVVHDLLQHYYKCTFDLIPFLPIPNSVHDSNERRKAAYSRGSVSRKDWNKHNYNWQPHTSNMEGVVEVILTVTCHKPYPSSQTLAT